MVTLEQAKKLTTKRLLKYYKKYGNKWSAKYLCDCGCGDFLWDILSNEEDRDSYYEEQAYWDSIKKILDSRENIA